MPLEEAARRQRLLAKPDSPASVPYRPCFADLDRTKVLVPDCRWSYIAPLTYVVGANEAVEVPAFDRQKVRVVADIHIRIHDAGSPEADQTAGATVAQI